LFLNYIEKLKGYDRGLNNKQPFTLWFVDLSDPNKIVTELWI
jgi:hypothetical protein